MIQPNELRIGNIVYAYPFMIIRVCEINETGVLNQGDETEEPFIFEDLDGIPLTKEILDKAFENPLDGWGSEPDDWSILILPDFIFRYREETKKYYIPDGEGGFISAGFNCMHQLQNLYFALTGTELEIKI